MNAYCSLAVQYMQRRESIRLPLDYNKINNLTKPIAESEAQDNYLI